MEPAIRHIPASFQQIAANIAGMEIETDKVVSLFSGCGGMDLGFTGGFSFGGKYYDHLPFDIAWANDINKAACETYRENMDHDIHEGDVMELLDTLPESAEVVIGGFPCQDVSINGKGDAENGERSVLYKTMIEVIRIVRPKVFVAENVKGIMSHKAFFEQFLDDFATLDGYTLIHQLYNAADYGVPQKRERLFFVGVEGEIPFKHPSPTCALYMTASKALNDLEDEPGNAGNRPRMEQGRGRVPNRAIAICGRMNHQQRYAQKHHGNIQWHYAKDRRISLREAARLQSFPDEFKLTSGMRETERQIGNAVHLSLRGIWQKRFVNIFIHDIRQVPQDSR